MTGIFRGVWLVCSILQNLSGEREETAGLASAARICGARSGKRSAASCGSGTEAEAAPKTKSLRTAAGASHALRFVLRRKRDGEILPSPWCPYRKDPEEEKAVRRD